MRVKRYIVDTMPEALEKIKVDLGKDAIILNTKPIKTGGFLGLFGKQQIEVIAAVDQKEREKADTARQASLPIQTSSNRAATRAYQSSTIAKGQSTGIAELDTPREGTIRTVQASSTAPDDLGGTSTRKATAAAAETQPLGIERADDKLIANELRDMREMFQKLLLLKESSKNVPGPILVIRDRLLEQGIEEEWVAQVMKKLLLTFDDPSAISQEAANQQASAIIKTMLAESSAEPARINRAVKYAFFFGPTGVGKTTTIAKLAAEAMLKEKRKVGFITSDTFRIAAVEQLKTYANILNVPLEVVFSPKEIEQAMERLGDCDLIFVDTAGRNYRNDEYVKGIKELLQYGETSVNFLVMSLTTKYADMKAILDQFDDLPGGRAIFTKADETDAYGSIFNVTQQYNLSLSYITTGQNVPDDIMLATPELVTTMIVGDEIYA